MAKQIKYTDEFRREAVKMYHQGNASASQVARKLGIHEHTMCRWIELYGENRVVPAQALLPQKHCVKQQLGVGHPYALEYIRAIKRHVGALEQMLLQQVDCKEAGE